jgi:hypothetical protein
VRAILTLNQLWSGSSDPLPTTAPVIILRDDEWWLLSRLVPQPTKDVGATVYEHAGRVRKVVLS